MDSRYVLNVGLSLLSGGAYEGGSRMQFDAGFDQRFWTDIDVVPGAVVLSLGVITAPKLLIIQGGVGIMFTCGYEFEQRPADPLAILAKSTGIPMGINTITISNSGAATVRVTVIALQ